MKLLAFIPIKLALFLILGILIGNYFPFSIKIALVATLLFFTILSIIFLKEKHTRSVLFGFVVGFTTVSLGILTAVQAQPKNHASHYSKLSIKTEQKWTLKITEALKPTPFSQRYIADVKSLDDSFATGKILLNRPKDSIAESLKVDDELIVYSSRQPIKSPLNPHQFNYMAYLERLGVYHELRLSSINYFTTKEPSITIYGLAEKARNHIVQKLKRSNFGTDELGVIQALLLGQRSDISEETYTNYKNAGAVHILAVSGLHIGVLLLLIQFLLRPLEYLRRGKTLSLVITVFLLWGFAFLAGLSASIIRACTMFTFVAYALYLNRPSNTFNILALSISFILLFIDPNLLFQVGFQMSYAAVFAIVWLYPLLQKLWLPKHKAVRYIWQLLSVSIAAQLGVLPISLLYFHQFPGLFFVSNLLIIPFLGLILGTGILVIFLSLINMLPDWLAWFFNELISLMNGIVAWVANQEDFIFKSIPFGKGQLVLAYLCIFSLILLLTQINYKKIVLFLVSLLGFQCWTIYQDYAASKTTETLVLHQTKNSILLSRTGQQARVLTNNPEASQKLMESYQIGERINDITFDSLINGYTILGEPFLVIDSLGAYSKTDQGSIVLLTHSPKINLDRLIQISRPKSIIADGSNYSSYVTRWKKTCRQYKIPFHYTGEKGAYYFK